MDEIGYLYNQPYTLEEKIKKLEHLMYWMEVEGWYGVRNCLNEYKNVLIELDRRK